jgi:mannosyl-oligosaccharide glucosidase
MISARWQPAMRSLIAFLGVALFLGSGAHAADDSSILINEIGRASNQSLLWGPYKPNLYFGVRPRIPKSLAAGLLWVKVDNFQDVQHSTLSTLP